MLVVHIVNDGTAETPDTGNYRVDVYVNHRRVGGGRVTGHPRRDSWRALLARLIEQLPHDLTNPNAHV